jgi:hypothetical protein
VLTYQAQHGFIPGSQAPLVALPFDLAPDDLAGLQNTIAHVAGSYLGIALPMSAQTQDVWDISTAAADGDPTPNSWGGHCVLAWEYDGLGETDLVTLITWGAEKSATWRWLRKYMDESHGMASRLLTAPGHRGTMPRNKDRCRPATPSNRCGRQQGSLYRSIPRHSSKPASNRLRSTSAHQVELPSTGRGRVAADMRRRELQPPDQCPSRR